MNLSQSASAEFSDEMVTSIVEVSAICFMVQEINEEHLQTDRCASGTQCE
jgi:hypothetical protein